MPDLLGGIRRANDADVVLAYFLHGVPEQRLVGQALLSRL